MNEQSWIMLLSQISGVFESRECGVIFNITAASFRMEVSAHLSVDDLPLSVSVLQ